MPERGRVHYGQTLENNKRTVEALGYCNGRELSLDAASLCSALSGAKPVGELSRKMEKKTLGKWRWNERIIPIGTSELERLEHVFSELDGERALDFTRLMVDFAPILARILHGPRTRIRDMIGSNHVTGLQRRLLRWYWVLAAPDRSMFRWPLNPSHTVLGKTPIDQGFRKYMRYIKKAGYLESIDFDVKTEDADAFAGQLELALVEEGLIEAKTDRLSNNEV